MLTVLVGMISAPIIPAAIVRGIRLLLWRNGGKCGTWKRVYRMLGHCGRRVLGANGGGRIRLLLISPGVRGTICGGFLRVIWFVS